VQAILFFALLMFLNAYIALFYDQSRQSKLEDFDQIDVEGHQLHSRATRARDVLEVVSHPGHGSIQIDSNQNVDIKKIQADVDHHSSLNSTNSNKKEVKTTIYLKEIVKSTKSKNSVENIVKSTTIPIDHGNDNKVNALLNAEIDYSLDISESRETELSDIFISVKTTKKFHNDRVGLLLDTWAHLAKDEVIYFYKPNQFLLYIYII
jgi:hypothetical protein